MNGLAVKNIHVMLGGKSVLQGVSAAFERGQVTAVVGPNGAGKSTLLACLAGLRIPDAGQVVLDHADISTLPARIRAQRIGFLPQIAEVAWAVEARTLVGLGRTPFTGARGLTAEDAAAVDNALTLTATQNLAHRIVPTLSGGERARVLLARVLAGNPLWLLADEPLAGLDPGHQLDAADLFRKLAHEQARGVIVTLHDLPMALRLADRVLVLADGRILADDAPDKALSPAVLAQAYGIEARVAAGQAGPMIEILGKRG